jgi:hypothetical protein
MVQLSPSSLPILTPHAVVSKVEDGVLIQASAGDVRYKGSAAASVLTLIKHLNGKNSLRALALRQDWSVDKVLQLIEPAFEINGIADVRPVTQAKDIDSQLAKYYLLCDAWALNIFDRPFWTTVLSGQASEDIVLGWCIEFYHRTVGADEHNALSVKNCYDPQIRSWLVAHFNEEFGHGKLFLDGLEGCGFQRTAILQSSPLPTTKNLIGYMNHLAKTDTIGYLGCYGVLHSPRRDQTLERVRDQFDQFSLLYPFAEPAISKIKQHAEIDLLAGHDEILLERLIRERGQLDPNMALRVVWAAHGMVAVFCRFFDGILDHYQQVGIARSRTCNPTFVGYSVTLDSSLGPSARNKQLLPCGRPDGARSHS